MLTSISLLEHHFPDYRPTFQRSTNRQAIRQQLEQHRRVQCAQHAHLEAWASRSPFPEYSVSMASNHIIFR